MTTEISIKNIHGSIDAIASKSEAHRVLIASALSDKPTKIILNSTSKDIEQTAECLKKVGATILKTEYGILAEPIKNLPDSAIFDCGESGSTIRFMIPVAAALGIDSVFTGEGRLPERPQKPLLEVLEKQGCQVSEDGEFPIRIKGKPKNGIFTIKGNISSQFITGLIFALPLLDGDSEIRLIPPVESRPYIDMTIVTVQKFGIEIIEKNNSFYIKGNQKYTSPKEIRIDGDWSNGAFFICAGALSCVTVNGLSKNSIQGDKGIIDIVRRMGADIIQNEHDVTVKKNKLHGTDIDASDIPDLVPVIAALACFAEGKTTILNAERLRIKESDRLKTVAELISSAGGDVTETPDGLIINGNKPLKKKFTVSSFNDHRLVMAAAILSFGSEVTITNAQAINKSYPSFFSDIQKLGGFINPLHDK